MKRETIKQQIKELENIISPYQAQIEILKDKFRMLNYNELRLIIQDEIDILQKQLPHLGKFYFDTEYDPYDDYTMYYIYYENEESLEDKKVIGKSYRKLDKISKSYTVLISIEPYNITMNKLFGREER